MKKTLFFCQQCFSNCLFIHFLSSFSCVNIWVHACMFVCMYASSVSSAPFIIRNMSMLTHSLCKRIMSQKLYGG